MLGKYRIGYIGDIGYTKDCFLTGKELLNQNALIAKWLNG